MVLTIHSVHKKLSSLESTIQKALVSPADLVVPEIPGREIEYLPINHLSGRIGLSTPEGQQKLMHDLANIELQAMELGIRTLIEFPDTPSDFKQQLVEIIEDEARHLSHCLKALDSLGGYWGKWPVHLGLWHATDKKDTLLERVFTVHRYLEGSGLDAGDTLLRRLSGVNNPVVTQVVKMIVDEEVGHVHFGSRWYKQLCYGLDVDPDQFFKRVSARLMLKHPRRDKISRDLRRQADFLESEIQFLEQLRL